MPDSYDALPSLVCQALSDSVKSTTIAIVQSLQRHQGVFLAGSSRSGKTLLLETLLSFHFSPADVFSFQQPPSTLDQVRDIIATIDATHSGQVLFLGLSTLLPDTLIFQFKETVL
jgi:hypothetical protein